MNAHDFDPTTPRAARDEGISGAKGRDRRPGFAALHAGIARRDFDMVAAWSVDRLGRSLQDLVGFLGELHGKGVDLFLLRQGLDTGTPSGRMLFGMLSVFSEFERAMIQERVKSGLARASALSSRSLHSWDLRRLRRTGGRRDEFGHERVIRLLQGLLANWPADAGDKGLRDIFTPEQLEAIVDAAYDPRSRNPTDGRARRHQ